MAGPLAEAGLNLVSMVDSRARDIRTAPIEEQLPVLVDEHRSKLLACLQGMSEEEARRSLVPSRTTLLSLAKHAIFVETVWFGEVVTGRYRAEYGLPSDSSDSFILDDNDTVDSITETYWRAVERLLPHCNTSGKETSLPQMKTSGNTDTLPQIGTSGRLTRYSRPD